MGWWVFIVVLVCIVVFLFYASFNISSSVYIKALCKGNTDERIVCLTFDDGPDPVYTPQVLKVLKKHQIQATFFCIGEKAADQSPLVRQISAEGHILGNHSMTHSWKFPFYSYEKMADDLQRAETKILCNESRTGILFRPPFGVTNPTIAKVIYNMRGTVIGWSIRSFDTVDKSEERVFRRIVKQIKPGAVILLHDRMPGCASLVARLLEHLKEIDYKVVPLNEMFCVPNLFKDEDDI